MALVAAPQASCNLYPRQRLTGTCQALEVNKTFSLQETTGQGASCQAHAKEVTAQVARKGVTPLTGPRGRTLLEDISLNPLTPPSPSANILAARNQRNRQLPATPWRAWETLGMSLASLDLVPIYTLRVGQDGATVPWAMTR